VNKRGPHTRVNKGGSGVNKEQRCFECGERSFVDVESRLNKERAVCDDATHTHTHTHRWHTPMAYADAIRRWSPQLGKNL